MAIGKTFIQILGPKEGFPNNPGFPTLFLQKQTDVTKSVFGFNDGNGNTYSAFLCLEQGTTPGFDLNKMADFNIVSPVNNQVLTYNSTSKKWENETVSGGGGTTTLVQPGSNITTGGTSASPIISVIASPFFNNLNSSGSSQLNTITAVSVSGGTLSGKTLQILDSASTNVLQVNGTNSQNIYMGSTSKDVSIQMGFDPETNVNNSNPINVQRNVNESSFLSFTNLNSGNTALSALLISNDLGTDCVFGVTSSGWGGGLGLPKDSLVVGTLGSNPVFALSNWNFASSITASTIYSGSTNLQTIFNSLNSQFSTKASLSGATFTGQITGTALSATTLSGGTIYSGSTNLQTTINALNARIATLSKASFGTTVDGNGIVISTGSTGFVVVPYAGAITSWYIIGDQSGSTQVDLRRNGVSIIGAGNKPILSSAQRANANVSSWTSTAITAYDEFEFVVESATTVTRINLFIEVLKS